MYIAVGKLHNARLASSTVCFSLLRLEKRQPLAFSRSVLGYDDSSPLPLVQGVLIASLLSLLFRLFRETAESMAISLSRFQGRNWDRLPKSVVDSDTYIYIYIYIRMRVDRASGKTACDVAWRDTHVCIYKCTHAYTYTYACTLPKDSKRQMLKRPMETGHVDVAADASHRTVAQHESL